MTQDTLQELLDQAELQMIDLKQTLAQLRQNVENLQHQNNRLRLANAELKDKIVPVIERSLQANQDNDVPFSGLESLQSFYDEGIHVCHEFFGSRLLPEEQCLFCQDVIRRLK